MSNNAAVVIVGATGGIGQELARGLARSGRPLMLAARNSEKLTTLTSELRALGSPCEERVTNAREAAEVDALLDSAREAFGSVSGVVNLCGSILLKPAHLTSDNEFADTIALNLTTAFNLLRASVKAMTEGGSIVLMSSVAARIGLANHEAIAAAKAGVIGLMISAAATYANRNIRVNAVAPGLVRTPLAARITSNELALKASTSMHPLGRIGEPADIVAAIMWLLDPQTTWVTGQTISVDGGLSTVRSK